MRSSSCLCDPLYRTRAPVLRYNLQVTMSEEVTSQLLRIAVAHTLRPLGWHSVGTSACDVLADVMGRYMLTVAKTTAAYSCHGMCCKVLQWNPC